MTDLVRTSGRETMSRDERIALLRAENVLLRAAVPVRAGGAWSGLDIHDFVGLLTSYLDMTLSVLNRRPHDISGADLSLIECRILAWRRGGISELRRVREGQRGT